MRAKVMQTVAAVAAINMGSTPYAVDKTDRMLLNNMYYFHLLFPNGLPTIPHIQICLRVDGGLRKLIDGYRKKGRRVVGLAATGYVRP